MEPARFDAWLEKIAERRAKRGLPTPSWDSRPQLHDDLVDVWESFVILSDFRAVALEANPIALTDLQVWMDETHVAPWRRAEFMQAVMALDSELRRRAKGKGKRGNDEPASGDRREGDAPRRPRGRARPPRSPA